MNVYMEAKIFYNSTVAYYFSVSFTLLHYHCIFYITLFQSSMYIKLLQSFKLILKLNQDQGKNF